VKVVIPRFFVLVADVLGEEFFPELVELLAVVFTDPVDDLLGSVGDGFAFGDGVWAWGADFEEFLELEDG